MTFEEELRRAFDTLTDRFRHELDHHASAALDALAQSARAERDEAVGRAAGAGGSAARLWLLRDDRLASWTSDANAQTEEVALDEDRAVAAAARNNAPALRDGVERAFPLTLAGEVVAVVDVSAANRRPDAHPQTAEALEILARYASRALEAITAFKTARAVVRTPAEPAGGP